MNKTIEEEGSQFELFLNYFEIYNESLNDLLQPNPKLGLNLKMMGNKILNSYQVTVQSPEQIFYYIQQG
jgi:hypothetical protein